MRTFGVDFQLHHVGCLVRSIEAAARTTLGSLANNSIGKPIRIASQKVSVCFLPMVPGVFIELVEPDIDNKALQRMLDRGISFYHVGLLCHDIETAHQTFLDRGARAISSFSSEAFEGRRCMFFVLEDGQMIELVEASPISR